ncbi:MAG: transketolase [Woeseia sp.]
MISPTEARRPDRRDLANAIRVLSMDAVQQANSGHPGMPMGMADIAEVLWNDYLKHNPGNPRWYDRDRFVLSNGHGSMLLYSLLHLSGYPLTMDEIRNFRQLGSKTPGHPEREPDLGIETTTGPLGQGLSNSVGMALTEKMLAATFNRPGFNIVDHRTFTFVGDGCLMEGISHEACSLAGTLKLGKLICFYDDNGISIDGEVDAWFSDDTARRFEAYGWQVIPDVDGHDSAAVARALDEALEDSERPSMIVCKTVIGWGAPGKKGTASTHGAPLGAEEIAAARKELGWTSAAFTVPDEIRSAWSATDRGARQEQEWIDRFSAWRAEHPELAAEFERRMQGRLPDTWREDSAAAIAEIAAAGKNMATRKASLESLNAFAPLLPELAGGSADLTGSNLTKHEGSVAVTGDEAGGNYIYFGVREFGMSAICNGISLHGGVIPYCGTFLTFSDYARNALRMAALMKARNIFVYTHDSIGLGEDGPTHQPVEHLASLRIIPNMRVWRPCDTVETAVAWRDAIERVDGPTSLILTRQSVPHQARSEEQLASIERGGYILQDCPARPDILLIATGSEVSLAMDAARTLAGQGTAARVVSMPCVDLFDAQPEDYRNTVLPPELTARVVIEAGVGDLWWRFAGPAGRIVAMHGFGESAPAEELFAEFGFTADNVLRVARELLQR